MELSFVIVNWNTWEELRRSLTSLFSAVQLSSFEVLVVDNSGGKRVLEADFPRVRWIWNPRNLGFAAAANQGLATTLGDVLFYVNPDVGFLPGSTELLLSRLKGQPDVGAAAGALLGPDGKPQQGFNVRGFPSLTNQCLDLLLLDSLVPSNPWTRRYKPRLPSDREVFVDQPAGACLMVRRKALEQVGGWDTRFHPAWFEDVDLCLRLKKAGWKILFVPVARFLHEGASSLKYLPRGDFFPLYYQNLIRYFAKHHGWVQTLVLRAACAMGMAERWLAAWLRGEDKEGRRGYLATIKLALSKLEVNSQWSLVNGQPNDE